MRAFVGTADRSGLFHIIAEDAVHPDVLGFYATERFPRPTSTVWALLHDQDAEMIRAEVGAGRYQDACALLLNRAIELVTLASVIRERSR
jgi:hypothetical protein